MNKFTFKVIYKDKEYTVEMIDFVNERVAFSIIGDDMQKQGSSC